MELKRILFILIIILFLVTRLYKINEIPASLYWDEASIAYNAYSITQNGQDEWGDFLPLHLRAFGEFKLPVYIYTVSLFQMILGFNEWSLRLPAVVFSLGTIIVIYLIGKNMFYSITTGLLGAFILTVTPGYFIFSRTGYEATAGLFFFMLGVYVFFKSLQMPKLLLFSAISLALSMYSYNSFRLLVPLALPFLIFSYFRHQSGFIQLKHPLLFVLVLVLSYAPILRFLLSPEGGTRFERVSLFNRDTEISLLPQLIQNYLGHFNLHFLFISGDLNQRSHLQGFGELYWIFVPFLISGVLYLFWKNKPLNIWVILITLIAPIPAVITKESPHALRSIALFPFFSLVTALGITQLIGYLKYKTLLLSIILMIFLGSFGVYWNAFLTRYNNASSGDWQYPYKQLFLSYQDKFKMYDKVIISDRYGQPYIFALYYLKYPPEKFRSEVKYNRADKWGISTVSEFANFEFKNLEIDSLPTGRYLVFVDPDQKIAQLSESKIIEDLTGKVAFYVYDIEK